jgi:hypothetical protein
MSESNESNMPPFIGYARPMTFEEAKWTERIIELEADLEQAVQMYTDAAAERDRKIAELAKVREYATTLAKSMHRQHYAEAAPKWGYSRKSTTCMPVCAMTSLTWRSKTSGLSACLWQ